MAKWQLLVAEKDQLGRDAQANHPPMPALTKLGSKDFLACTFLNTATNLKNDLIFLLQKLLKQLSVHYDAVGVVYNESQSTAPKFCPELVEGGVNGAELLYHAYQNLCKSQKMTVTFFKCNTFDWHTTPTDQKEAIDEILYRVDLYLTIYWKHLLDSNNAEMTRKGDAINHLSKRIDTTFKSMSKYLTKMHDTNTKQNNSPKLKRSKGGSLKIMTPV